MDCWEWDKYKNPDGYGMVKHEGKEYLVHRLAYEAIIGPIPVGLETDHLCQNRACYNPEHLEAVTHRENLRRSWKTHCIRGHPRSEDNIYVGKNRKVRQCKACHNARGREWRAENPEKFRKYQREYYQKRKAQRRLNGV